MLDRDTLYRLYVEEEKSIEEIAKIANMKLTKSVTALLRKYDIPRRQSEPFRPPISKEMLYDLYWNERMTAQEIAQLFGKKSPETIIKWMKAFDIPRRDVREAQRAIIPSKDELYQLYVVQEMSIDNIARQVGSSEVSITNLLKQYDITIRSKTWKAAGWNKGVSLPDQRKIALSALAKTRTGEKSPRYGVKLPSHTRKKIAGSLKGKYRKHLNPNWKNGGISKFRKIIHGQFEYKDWRRAVYERDGYTCQMCQKPSKGDIEAHHIHPVKDCPERILDVTNGITLCESCHRSIHWKEDQYIAQFEAIIQAHSPNQ